MNEINYQFNLNFCKVNASCIDLQKQKKVQNRLTQKFKCVIIIECHGSVAQLDRAHAL